LTQNIPSILDDRLNDRLVAKISEEEVRDAVFEMGGSKAPGPDGFPGSFFQSFWDIVGTEVVVAVQDFQISKFMPRDVNLPL